MERVDTAKAIAEIDTALAAMQRARAELAAPTVHMCRPGESLQAALDTHKVVQLQTGNYDGVVLRGGMRLIGAPGAIVRGGAAFALEVPEGVRDVKVSAVDAYSDNREGVVVVGNNVTQKTVAAAPAAVEFSGVRVLSHRGKRAFAIHGAVVSLVECSVADTWDPFGADSQAVWINNAPGDVILTGGSYAAGSEVVLLGGAATAIPGLVPSNISLLGVRLWRPLEWQTDGVNRTVKNLFEAKNGEHITLRGCTLRGNWKDGQDGECIVLTPTRGGVVRDVLIEGCDIADTGSGIELLGRDYKSYTAGRASLLVRHTRLVTNRAVYGGFGQFVKCAAEPEGIALFDNVVLTDGSSLVYFYRGSVMEESGFLRAGGNLLSLQLLGNKAWAGSYGLNLDGYPNAREWQRCVDALEVTGNTFGGTGMKGALPSNTYMTAEEFKAAGF